MGVGSSQHIIQCFSITRGATHQCLLAAVAQEVDSGCPVTQRLVDILVCHFVLCPWMNRWLRGLCEVLRCTVKVLEKCSVSAVHFSFAICQVCPEKLLNYSLLLHYIIRQKSIILFYLMYFYFVIFFVGWCAIDLFFQCEKCAMAQKRLGITALIYFNIIPTSSALQRRESLFSLSTCGCVPVEVSVKSLWMRFGFQWGIIEKKKVSFCAKWWTKIFWNVSVAALSLPVPLCSRALCAQDAFFAVRSGLLLQKPLLNYIVFPFLLVLFLPSWSFLVWASGSVPVRVCELRVTKVR